MKLVNLARRPFENLRPVRRLTALFWILGGAFLAINLWLFWGHLTGFSATRGRLADVRASIAAETEQLDRLEADVAALELDSQNETVTNLNHLIEKRVFPWGLLFDRLEAVLPNDVRLQSVRPQGQELRIERARSTSARSNDRGRRSRSRRAARRSDASPEVQGVTIDLTASARNDEALLDFVDTLWDDSTFTDPTLRSERRGQNNEIEFSLDVRFLTAVAEAMADGTAPTTPSDDAAAVTTAATTEAPPAAAVPAVDAAGETTPSASPPADAIASAPTAGEPTATTPDPTSSVATRDEPTVPSTRTTAAPPTTTARSWRRASRDRDGEAAEQGEPSTRPQVRPRGRTGSTPAERAGTPTPQIPGVVVLPGARSTAGATQPSAAPSPTTPTPGTSRPTPPAPTRPGTRPRPTSPATAPDPDTPAPPSSNASAGASIGGGR